MSYQSMEEAKLRGEKENIPFWKAIQLEDAIHVAVHAGRAGRI